MADEDAEKKPLPECFGELERVFPMGSHGLRETPDPCMFSCPHKTQCLKQAMSGTGGLSVKHEMVARGEKAGNIGFLQRWSRKKNFIDNRWIWEKKNEISKRS